MDDIINKIILLLPLILVLVGGGKFWLLKNEERLTLNRAILSEIFRLFLVLNSHLKWWLNCVENNKTNLPLIQFSLDVHDTYLNKIANLDSQYIFNVVKFYGYIKYLNYLQKSKYKFSKKDLNDFVSIYTNSLHGILEFEKEFSKAFKAYNIKHSEHT